MKITKLKINNFRSFGKTEKQINLSDITTLIGSNSSGKTAALQALQKMFGVTQSERRLVKGDFYIANDVDINTIKELDLYIEVKIEFPELDNEGNDGEFSVPPFFSHFTIDSSDQRPYVRMRLVGNWYSDNTPDGDIQQNLFFINVPEGEEVTEESLLPVSPHQRSKIQMLYVPAVREPMKQLKNASGTILSRILNSISWPEDMNQQIKDEMSPVNDLFNSIEGVGGIKEIIGEQWKKYHSDSRYNEAKLEFNSTTLESILSKIEVQFSPSVESNPYTVDKLGDGLQSLFYLSLVSSLLEVEKKISKNSGAALTILAVEEPENHISPHLLGKVVENLNEISQISNAQVLLTSHSESIIKNISPEELCHLRIDKTTCSTVVSSIILPSKSSNAYTYIKEAIKAYPEVYFAKLVILGEGDTEEIILPKLLKVKEISSYDTGISVVPLGGRHVNHMWRLLNQLNIPHITLLDLDLERGGGGWSRIKYVIKELIENGYARNKLLETEEGILSEDEFSKMHKWKINIDILTPWIEMLEEYNVFFSSPLDIDFLMLERFPTKYKETMSIGPRLPDKETEPDSYRKKVISSIQATLKNENATGYTYSQEQHELMVWYNSLFLGRGKPSTHIDALARLSDSELIEKCPEVFERLINKIRSLISL
ncbi:ATP-dependent nuclease [Robertmurraya andreesenii]|uniref:ATP-dependent endonuclease of OLD family n=1 Tax=Anoxybacillus andreesenii TaxID=1325932 RepID=A0ABT9VAG0_9BACL|nr:AAA family ATPase [Robertmurraya andreesenii]MDQ0157907.1 putative ATP-dependent endonuclease of OLD family [Robertmurraya andreesenii]